MGGGGPVAPVAAFTGTPTSGTVPLTVTFTDQSTGSPTSWSWTFGDGGTSTAQNPVHTYNSTGTYTVTLTATNAVGSDSETKTNYITVNACNAPVANFIGSPTIGRRPAHRELHRPVDELPHLVELDLRRRRHLDRAEPVARLLHGRHLHGDADGRRTAAARTRRPRPTTSR